MLIVGAVAGHFARLLARSELWENPFTVRPLWILGTVAGYGLAFAIWGAFWARLLRGRRARVPSWPIARAYFVSQLGKYVPGKALAIVLRALLIRPAGVPFQIAAITAVYETLTVMASGSLLAGGLLPLVEIGSPDHHWRNLGLLALVGIPLLPGIFNRLAPRAARLFMSSDAPPTPRLGFGDLILGLVQTAIGWCFLGFSLLMLLRAFGEWRFSLVSCTVFVACSYVAGFFTLPAPGGLGIREVLLQQLLAGGLGESWGEVRGEALAVLVALSLRFWWTVTEVGLAGLVYLLPQGTRRP